MNTLFDIPLSKEDKLLRKFEEIHDYSYANDGPLPHSGIRRLASFYHQYELLFELIGKINFVHYPKISATAFL